MIDITSKFLAEQGFSETFPQRFWAKVNKNGPVPEHCRELGACWLWTGSIMKSGGYGQIHAGIVRKPIRAHVASWVLHFGPVKDGLFVLHKCDVPACVRPTHLFTGTQVDNLNDMLAKCRNPWVGLPGELNGSHKLTEAQVLEIRKIHSDGGITMVALANRFGVSPFLVGEIIHRRLWKHI